MQNLNNSALGHFVAIYANTKFLIAVTFHGWHKKTLRQRKNGKS